MRGAGALRWLPPAVGALWTGALWMGAVGGVGGLGGCQGTRPGGISPSDASVDRGDADPSRCLADWPMPNPPGTGLPHPQSYDTSNADHVLDRVTGLVWQRTLEPGGFNWSDANPYCANLVLAGTNGWRLPRMVELVSIVDFTRAMPAIDTDAFPDTPSVPFWTSQTDVTNAGLAWYVFFRNGGGYGGNDIVDVQQVRCVRGGVTTSGPCTTIAGGTVRDNKTTLVWQQALDPESRSWGDAQAYCAALDLGVGTDGGAGAGGGGAGWRLPSLNELMTIVDFGRVDPAIDPATYPDTPSDFFWSSSAVTGSATTAWGVNFNRGSSGAAQVDYLSRVRCVAVAP